MHNRIRPARAAIACLSALLWAGCGQSTPAGTAAADPDASNTADAAIAGTDAEVAAADVAQVDVADTGPDVDGDVATDAAAVDSAPPDVLIADTASPDGDTADAGTVDADTGAPDVEPATDVAAVCVPLDCDDGNPCTLDACNAANACVHSAKPDGASCSDGNACTSGDACAGGKCVGALAVKCAGNACTLDTCDPKTGKCVAVADGSACDDASQCTAFDACTAGACVGKPIDVAAMCDDGNACTTDACAASSGCTHTSNTAPCDDNDACTYGDACSGGKCAPGTAKNCDDGNACTVDACSGGVCVPGSPKNCDDGNDCTLDGCDVAKGCTQTDLADGVTCTLAGGCAIGASCSAGACTSKGAKVFDTTYTGATVANALVSLADGFAFASATNAKGAGGYDFWLVRTDAAGKVLWDQTYGGTGNETAPAMVSLPDGFALAGSTTSAGGSVPAWLVRTDTAGKQVWAQTYSVGVWGLAALPDGFALGTAGYGGILRTDAVGNKLWAQTYTFGSMGTAPVSATTIAALSDGFILAGELGGGAAGLGATQARLVRTDVAGNKLWENFYGGTGNGDPAGSCCYGGIMPGALAVLPDGFAFLTQNFATGVQVLVRTDAAGKQLWDLPVGGNGGGLSAIVGLADGFAMAGQNGGPGWLVRTNPVGTVLWDQKYGVGTATTAADVGDDSSALVALPDGFAIAGSRSAAGVSGARLIRTDAWGHASCAGSGPCVGKLLAGCDDSNACTTDSCDAAKGCTHVALAAGTTCAAGKTCKFGACSP